MARIRTVKPSLFKHENLFDLERETKLPVRLAFIGLFTCCDRDGRFQWRPRVLKLDVLPYDDDIDFSRVLDALLTRGFLRKYSVNGEMYGVIPTFSKHQVINNRESESEIPAPDESAYISTTSTREARVSHATSTPLVHAQGEGEKEGKGREEEEEGKGKGNDVALRARREQVAAVFDHWRQIMDHARSVLDDKRRKLIEARLKDGYSAEDLTNAITGCSLSPFHMGHNEQGTRYDGLELILRDGSKVDKFLATYRNPPRPLGKQGQIEARNQAAVDEFLGDAMIIDMEAGHA